MYETHATVVGTVITNPVKRQTTNGEEVLSFRMASNTRRKDAVTGEWTDGATPLSHGQLLAAVAHRRRRIHHEG